MRWKIYGTYWYSNDYLGQLVDVIDYYQSGERQVDDLAHMQAQLHMSRTGENITTTQFLEIKSGIRQQLKDMYKDRASSESIDQQIDKQFENYHKGMNGDVGAMRSLWLYLEDDDRLKLTLHLWEQRKSGKLDAQVWGAILRDTWQRGKIGCLLMEASLPPKTLAAMFAEACADTLMEDSFGISTESVIFKNLPEKFVIWRGVRANSNHRANGLSWTLDRNQACWFAYRNALICHDTPVLIQASVSREAVMAVFAYEQEVVVNPLKVHAMAALQVTELPQDKDGTYSQYYAEQLAEEVREASIEAV